MEIFNEPWFWILFAAASEIIALNPKLKSNSVIQLVLKLIKGLDGTKKSRKR